MTNPNHSDVPTGNLCQKELAHVTLYLGMTQGHFARFSNPYCPQSETKSECHSVTLKKIDWSLEVKASATLILNEYYFSDYRQRFPEYYHNARAEGNRRGDEDVRPEELIACDHFFFFFKKQ